MKRMLAVFLALALLLTTFAACGKKKPSAENGASEYELLYAPVLKKYKQAFDEGWSGEKFAENNLSPKLANLDKTAAPSFAFFDLNGDKTPELFIGRADQRATVYDMYTAAQDNTIRQLVVPTDETVPTLTDDNRLVKPQNSYAHLDIVTYYELEGDALTPADSYIHDAGQLIDGTDAWFHATGDLPASESEFYAEDMDVITEAEYNEKTTYTTGELAMKSFADLVLPDDTADAAEATQATETPADPMEAAKAAYAPIMDVYSQAMPYILSDVLNREASVPADLFDRGLNRAFVSDAFEKVTPGYMFIDLDHDGVMEMIIGTMELISGAFHPIYDLYTIENGQPVKVVQCFKTERFELCADGRIFNTSYADQSRSSVETFYGFYTFKNGYLTLDEAYGARELDYIKTTKEYHNVGTGFDDLRIANLGPIDDADLETIFVEEHDAAVGGVGRADLTLTPFDAAEPASEPATEAPAQSSDMASAKVGDYITFGHYEQDNNTANGPEPIEWLVLERKGDRALVISRYALDCRQYTDEYDGVTWETCTLRAWLKDTFYHTAFDTADENRILVSISEADANPETGTYPGNETHDKVFLLSIKEANESFDTDEARVCALTDYALAARGTYGGAGGDTCWWWLRTPGSDYSMAAIVDPSGSVYASGNDSTRSNGAVRPAMWIIVDA
ncbi:MAG: hypothetical protein IKN72_00980 [Clostridia bacterium]|nr:hypothetical protein [Clostridia bacterium]